LGARPIFVYCLILCLEAGITKIFGGYDEHAEGFGSILTLRFVMHLMGFSDGAEIGVIGAF
jgi:hypothetical protein